MPRKGTYMTKSSRSKGNEKENLKELAKRLLMPTNKNPYYLNGNQIRNLDDLVENLQGFTENDAVWVADWIDYLGDEKTAKAIRSKPTDFKKVITRRYDELHM